MDTPADLKRRILRMEIDGPDGRKLEQALAHEQGWSLGYAGKVAREYRRFLYLAATSGREVTPSRHVDEAWHLHLTWPHYDAVLCGSILRRPLDHREGTGDPEDEARFRRQYEDTLDLYRATFGTPSRRVWPQPTAEPEPESKFGPIFWTVLGVAACVVVLAGVFGSLLDFILLAVLLGIPIGIYASARPYEQEALLGDDRRHDTGGCGGLGAVWFGGDSSSDGGCTDGGADGGSCGASCGGSCGGGGCGGS